MNDTIKLLEDLKQHVFDTSYSDWCHTDTNIQWKTWYEGSTEESLVKRINDEINKLEGIRNEHQ